MQSIIKLGVPYPNCHAKHFCCLWVVGFQAWRLHMAVWFKFNFLCNNKELAISTSSISLVFYAIQRRSPENKRRKSFSQSLDPQEGSSIILGLRVQNIRRFILPYADRFPTRFTLTVLWFVFIFCLFCFSSVYFCIAYQLLYFQFLVCIT